MASSAAEAGDVGSTGAGEEEPTTQKQDNTPNFTFRTEAAEFVPGMKTFQFNPSACEFKPNADSTPEVARQADGSMQSPHSPHSPIMQPTVFQPVPVVLTPGAQVYPVIAVRQQPGGPRPFQFMAPVTALGGVSPTGHGPSQAVGFGPYHDSHSPHAGGSEFRKGGKGKGSKYRDGGHKGGYGSDGRHSQMSHHVQEEQQKAKKPADEQKEEVKEEEPKEEEKEEEEEEEDKGPKKTSWADIAKKSIAKPASPTKDAEPRQILPRKVATKARGPPPPASSLATPSVAPAAVAPASTAPSEAVPPAEVSADSPSEIAAPTNPGETANSAAEATPVASSAAPDGAQEAPSSEEAPTISEQQPDVDAETNEAEQPKEKGPLTWADRIKKAAAVPPQARPKKAPATAKPVGIPTSPSKAPWAKAAGLSPTAASPGKDAWEAPDGEKPMDSNQAAAKTEAVITEPAETETEESPSSKQNEPDTMLDTKGDEAEALEGEDEKELEEEQKEPEEAAKATTDMEAEVEQPVTPPPAAAETLSSPEKESGLEKASIPDKDEGDEDEEEDEDDLEEEEDGEVRNNDAESASTSASLDEEKAAREQAVGNGVVSASENDPQFGKPDANGIIKYSLPFLKSMAIAPASQGNCPPSIPACLRTGEEGEDAAQNSPIDDRKRYKMEFLKQFKGKAACQDLPANHRIPKDIRAGGGTPTANERTTSAEFGTGDAGDDWRAEQVKHQARHKDKDPKNSRGDRRDRGDRGDRRGSGGRQIERRPEEVLVSGENSWAQQQSKAKEESDAKVIREMKSILNKLTIEKFDRLYQKLIECGIETQLHIEKLMSEVFEKATTQHHFISMYTNLCIKLNEWLQDKAISGTDDKKVSFKRILLNQCQDSFENNLTPPTGLEQLSEDEQFEAKQKYKLKMLGNIKFVGELLINRVLSTKIIFSCTEMLLENPSEEKLETLCAFLNTIGPAYDSKEWRNYQDLSNVFAEVKDLSNLNNKKHDIPPRIKFLLRDVIDLRNNGWDKSTKPTNAPTGPMRMEDVQKQWAADHAEKGKTEKRGSKAPSPLQDADDDWETVGLARRGNSTKAGGAPTPLSRTISAPVNQSRPGSTRSDGNANSFGALDKKSKDKKDREWRRSDTAPDFQSSGRSEWKPRQPQIEKSSSQDLKRSTSNQSMDSAPVIRRGVSESSPLWTGEEEHSLQECKAEMKLTLNELASSHDVTEALGRIDTFKVPIKHQKAVVFEMVALIAEKRDSDRACLVGFLSKLVGADEAKRNIFQRKALSEGLRKFIDDRYMDTICDVPKLPLILQDEFLGELGKDALSSEEVASLSKQIKDAEAAASVEDENV